MKAEPTLAASSATSPESYIAAGDWTGTFASRLEKLLAHAAENSAALPNMAIRLEDISALDTYGARLLQRLTHSRTKLGVATQFVGLPDKYRGLFDYLDRVECRDSPPTERRKTPAEYVEAIGLQISRSGDDFAAYTRMLGAVSSSLLSVALRPRAFRLTSAVHNLDRVGFQAVPIILLITFLIGGILAQQGIFHFRKFGAEIYVVDMVGILILREIGVLIVAIMVAGRSGSSYTAELGSMKMREEIDALRTMGLDPIEVLILPRILALTIALPMLTFLGSMSALYGGGLIAWLYGGMSPDIFIERLREAISMTHFKVGIIKAPFMALVIGLVACSEGLRVKGSAESLGLRTTDSVVKSIFLVIVLDGLFAIFFASIGM